MQFEDIEIRITKRGEIYIKVEGATEQRLRDYHAFLEESVGPVREVQRIDRPDWEKPASLTAGEEEEEEQRKQRQELQH